VPLSITLRGLKPSSGHFPCQMFENSDFPPHLAMYAILFYSVFLSVPSFPFHVLLMSRMGMSPSLVLFPNGDVPRFLVFRRLLVSPSFSCPCRRPCLPSFNAISHSSKKALPPRDPFKQVLGGCLPTQRAGSLSPRFTWLTFPLDRTFPLPVTSGSMYRF